MGKLFIAILLFATWSLYGQISYIDRSELLGPVDYYNGLVMGIADLNNDYYEDLVHLNKDRQLVVHYQITDQSRFFNSGLGSPIGHSNWSLTIGDINNDGFNDLIFGGNDTGIEIWMMGPGEQVLAQIDLPESEFYVQATNLVDINADGWLDLFVCNDEGENKVYENDGTGGLIPNDSWFDFSQDEADLSSGNYGSVWTDINNDGLVDLYISKCKAQATSEDDLRRINQLFINLGDLKFDERAAEYGLALGAQSWVSDFGDIDNDGDMDAFVANHDRPSQLMINQDGHFVDYTDSMGVSIQGLIIQSKLVDLDNDGMLDIIVGGTSDMIYHNEGNYQFRRISTVPKVNTITTFALGDLNGDGFTDIYAGYPVQFVEPNVYPDQLFYARPNGNHYLDITLEGNLDNRNALGARCTLYGPWGLQVREIKIGEGYGVSHSTVVHFGLGEYQSIDSLVIHWPSGMKEVYTGMRMDQSYHIMQGTCLSPNFRFTQWMTSPASVEVIRLF